MTKILETNHFVLRTWTEADAEDLYEICRDDRVMKYIGAGVGYKTLKESVDFLNWAVAYQAKNNFCRWAVTEKSSGEIVGSCGFARPHKTEEIELGYLFAVKHWGKGFATEAASACLKFGFEKLGFPEVIALIDKENVASRKVLEKIGFAPRGIEIYNGRENLVYLAKNNIR